MIERLEITRYPTPVISGKAAGLENLWVKNDGLSSERYGGNKVRKLARIVPGALASGKGRILTAGAAGSHHVLASTIFAREAGLRTAAFLWPQPRSAHAERTLAAALSAGLEPLPVPTMAHAVAGLVSRRRRDDYVVPVGGAGLAAVLAFVDAAHELRRDVDAGRLPEPESIVVAVGTGTTAAGLLAGSVASGLRARVVGVAVATNPAAWAIVLGMAAWALAALGLGKKTPSLARRLLIDGARVGRGYGFATEEGRKAGQVASRLGLELDETYTQKAFGRALQEAGAEGFSAGGGGTRLPGPRRTLYWHTLSAIPFGRPPLESREVASRDDRLARLFTEPGQTPRHR